MSCISLSVLAQSGFHKSYRPQDGNYIIPFRHLPMDDGGFLLCSDGTLSRTDSMGKLQWNYQFEERIRLSDADLLPGNDILLAGVSTPKDSSAQNTDVIIIRLSQEGIIKWSRTYRHNGPANRVKARCFNNSIYVTGGIFNMKENLPSIFFLKIGADGSVLSQNSWEHESFEKVKDIAYRNGSLYVVGTSSYESGSSRDMFLMVADTNLQLVSYYEYDIPGITNEAENIIATPEGLVIAGNYWMNGSVFIIKSAGYSLPLKIEISDIILGPRVNNLYYSNYVRKLIRTASGAYYLAGDFYSGMFFSCIMRLDKDLNPLWARAESYTIKRGYMIDLATSPRGQISVSGSIQPIEGGPGEELFICTDSNVSNSCAFDIPFLIGKLTGVTAKKVQPVNRTFVWLDVVHTVTFRPVVLGDSDICGKQIPPVAGIAPGDTALCVGGSISFSDSSKRALLWNWEFEGGQPASYPGQHPPPVRYEATGIYRVKQLVINAGGKDSLIRYVRINPFPEADAGRDTSVCYGIPYMLNAKGGAYYDWSPAALLNPPDTKNPWIVPVNDSWFRVKVSDSIGCSASDSIYLKVIHPPDTTVGYDSVLCPFDMLLLDAGNSGFSYRWNTGEFKQYIIPANSGDYRVRISNRCFSGEATFKVHYTDCPPAWYIPNAFTPNGDGMNDVFTAEGEYISVNKMIIHNRWGQKIFEFIGANAGWDGNFNNVRCNGGIYIFQMEIRGADGQLYYPTGTIQLLE